MPGDRLATAEQQGSGFQRCLPVKHLQPDEAGAGEIFELWTQAQHRPDKRLAATGEAFEGEVFQRGAAIQLPPRHMALFDAQRAHRLGAIGFRPGIDQNLPHLLGKTGRDVEFIGQFAGVAHPMHAHRHIADLRLDKCHVRQRLGGQIDGADRLQQGA